MIKLVIVFSIKTGVKKQTFLFHQHDQLYTWAAVNQPSHSLDPLEGKLPGQLKDSWPPARPGGDNRTGLRCTEAGKNSASTQSVHIVYACRLANRPELMCST